MSARSKRKAAGARSSAWELPLARVLLLMAIGLSCYLAWISFSGQAALGCGPDSDCDQVLHGRWGYWLGVPVGLIGLGTYLGLLLASFWFNAPGESRRRYAGLTGVFFASLVMAGAIWFFFLQWVVLKRFCLFCLATHALAGLAAVLCWAHLAPASQSTPMASPGSCRRRSLMIAASVFGLLVLGQLFFPKKEFEVRSTPTLAAQITPNQAERTVELHQGRFKFSLAEFPLRGSTNAQHVLVSLFDYTCHHCRESHHLFDQALVQYSNRIAFLSLPMPLDAACNRLVKKTPHAHENACDYARLGLAVWRASRTAFAEFDNWLFAPPAPPSIDEARQKAAELVGADKLNLTDPWVGKTIQRSIDLFEANSRAMTNTQMPQLIIGKSIVLGPIKSMSDFQRMVEANLGL